MGRGDHLQTFLLKALFCESTPSWLKVVWWVGGPGHYTVISWDWGYFLFPFTIPNSHPHYPHHLHHPHHPHPQSPIPVHNPRPSPSPSRLTISESIICTPYVPRAASPRNKNVPRAASPWSFKYPGLHASSTFL